ncbi:hypothetical protein [Salinibacterium sp. NK8237]|uniref:hypothetical protein n=1 Tax=Salinibacterium sp. NK8237 TaxID=2792038 RepID=UPI0018CD489A|nr:hypothetical protein [Salinibacterium sp. NK8237]MBH0129697.1 hypothetical protein [Salinibacterium sp. NK8237]
MVAFVASVRRGGMAVVALGIAFVVLLAIASSAAAATPGATYVVDSAIAEGTPFGTDGWSNQNFSAGALVSTTAGLEIPSGGQPSYGFAPTLPLNTGSSLVALAATTSFTTTAPTQFYASIFIQNGAGTPIILYSQSPSEDFSDPSVKWIATSAIGSITPWVLGDPQRSLADFDAQLALDPTFVGGFIDAVSAYNAAPGAEQLSSFTANGVQFVFTPEPVFVAQTTITRSVFISSGITITSSGFLPDEAGIVVTLTSEGAPSVVGTVDADAAGQISFTYQHPDATAAAGTYSLSFAGSVPNTQVFEFELTVEPESPSTPSTTPPVSQPGETDVNAASAITPPAAQLAATGADVSGAALVSGILVLVGSVLLLSRARARRATPHRSRSV